MESVHDAPAIFYLVSMYTSSVSSQIASPENPTRKATVKTYEGFDRRSRARQAIPRISRVYLCACSLTAFLGFLALPEMRLREIAHLEQTR